MKVTFVDVDIDTLLFQPSIQEWLPEKHLAPKCGRNCRTNQPAATNSRPNTNDQIDLSDMESRIMPTSGGGFE